jgi:hypothetical protein
MLGRQLGSSSNKSWLVPAFESSRNSSFVSSVSTVKRHEPQVAQGEQIEAIPGFRIRAAESEEIHREERESKSSVD